MSRLICIILMLASISVLIASNACRRASGGVPAMAAPCQLALAAHSRKGEDGKVDREIVRLQQEIRSNSKSFQTTAMIEKLGWSYVEKARESFDPGFYKLAEQCALCLESKALEVKQSDSGSASQSANQPLASPQS